MSATDGVAGGTNARAVRGADVRSTRDQGTPELSRVTVVGGGVIGASFALASQELPGVHEVVLTDRDPGVRRRLRELGVGTRVADETASAVAGADLVVLAIPVRAIPDGMATLASCIGPETVITDVGSLKSRVLREVEVLLDALPGGADLLRRFIPGHPMAGSERSGPDAADGTLFQGATWVLTPHETVETAAFNALSAHLRGIGARVLAVTPVLHDELVAVTSHLPQVLASTLMDEAGELSRRVGAGALSVTGGGFRDVTRLAGSDPDLWTGILSGNRDALLSALDGFSRRLADLRAAIAGGDWIEVGSRMRRARDLHRRLPSKARAGNLVTIVVPVADTPGMLARVTTALGEAGVNVEDLSMRHASAGDRGALVVAVDGHDAARRAAALLEARQIACHLEGREVP